MTRFANSALTACVAVMLSLASISAIITVPPAQASVAATLVMPDIA
ncbi:MAG: hypothetical protein ACKO1N_01430 [Erythrobacter sp.]